MHGRDWAALILAVGAAGSTLILAMTAAFQDNVISPQGANLLTTALGVMIGAVATYLGQQRWGEKPKPPPEPPTPKVPEPR